MSGGPNITVNGVAIPAAAVRAEAQNHPAGTADEALDAAAEALVVRELLLQEVRRLGLSPEPAAYDDGRRETDEEALIRQLLEREVSVPTADEATCRRYYERNIERFRSPDLFEAAHILYAASPDDADTYARATEAAERSVAVLSDRPDRFGAVAEAESDCPSAKSGGNLGQVARGDTVPEFETFLLSLEEGQLCPVPVKTRFGVHVLRLDRRIEGRTIPFEAAQQKIAGYLEESAWRRAVAQYIAILGGRAHIEGIDFAATTSPLVQ